MTSRRDKVDFEATLADLERIVEQLEQGELTLEQSLRAYEQGVALGRACQKALDGAEQRIRVLTERDGELHEEPLEEPAGQTPAADDEPG